MPDSLGMGGKDLYRQARALWRLAQSGDVRCSEWYRRGWTPVPRPSTLLTKTYVAAIASVPIFAPRLTMSGRSGTIGPLAFPTRGDPASDHRTHASLLHDSNGASWLTRWPAEGPRLDVCQSMGRRCLAYDLHPVRPEILAHDIRHGFPTEAVDCDLIFCDPPYHTMLARHYSRDGIASAPLTEWVAFLHDLTRHAFATLRARRLPGPAPRRPD